VGDTRPLGGPKLGIFARKISEHGLHILFLGAAEDFLLPRVIADFCFDFRETLYATHSNLDDFCSTRTSSRYGNTIQNVERREWSPFVEMEGQIQVS